MVVSLLLCSRPWRAVDIEGRATEAARWEAQNRLAGDAAVLRLWLYRLSGEVVRWLVIIPRIAIMAHGHPDTSSGSAVFAAVDQRSDFFPGLNARGTGEGRC